MLCLNSLARLLFNRRLIFVLILGFASGLPLALIGSTLQAWFSAKNINIHTIGALSLIGLPYLFKFIWAPLTDKYSLLILGRRKTWIILMQCMLGGCLYALSELNPLSNAWIIGLVAFLIALFSATQDIAINAYTAEVLHEEERGLGASYTILGYRIGLLISGGVALISADYFGWTLTYKLFAFLMLGLMIFTIVAPAVKDDYAASSQQSVYQLTRAALTNLWTRNNILLIIGFVFLYKFGDALALVLMTNFLLQQLHFSLTEIGLAYKTVSIVATIGGSLIGGILLVRLNLFFALFSFGLAQSLSNLSFVGLAYWGKNFGIMIAAVGLENFCSGLSTAALLAFLMGLCDHRFTAYQFALFSAVAAVGRIIAGPLAAMLVAQFGWLLFFLLAFFMSLPGVFMVRLFRSDQAKIEASYA